MSTQNIRQRNAIRTTRSLHRTAATEWLATPEPRAVPPTPAPRPSLGDRIAAAGWRLHDGMPWAWAAAAAVVLLASAAATVAIAAMTLGWRP